MRADHIHELTRALRDERGHSVVLVSHCLLNENVRYLGGAFRSGFADEVVDRFRPAGVGLHQMPCPERCAWGGVLKRRILPFYGGRTRMSAVYHVRRPLLAVFTRYTSWRYARLARKIVDDIEDYIRSGIQIVGVVGVRGSPSCAMTGSCALSHCLEVVADCDPGHVDRRNLNEALLGGDLSSGEGLFVRALRRQLSRRDLRVPFLEFDLIAEMRGERPVPLRRL